MYNDLFSSTCMAIYSIDSWLLPKTVRFYMPRDQVVNKNLLGQDDERLNNGVIYVRVVDPCLMVHDDLGLTKWVTQTKSSFSFTLNKGWNSISTNNQVLYSGTSMARHPSSKGTYKMNVLYSGLPKWTRMRHEFRVFSLSCENR